MRLGRIAKNSAILLVAQVYSTLTLFIYIPLLTRYLGRDNYGRYNYAYAFVGLFQVLAFLGTHQILIRETARDKQKAGLYFGNLLVIKVILTAITMALILSAASLRGLTSEDLLIIAICATEMLIRIYANANVSIYRAFQRMEYELLVLVVDRSVGLVGILVVIYLRLDLVAVFLAFLASAMIRGIVSFYITLVKFVRPRFQLDLSLWKYFMAASTPIGVSLGIRRVYERGGTVILEAARSITEVGLFGASLRIYTMTGLGATSLLAALFPVFSELAVQSGDRLVKAYQATLKFLLLFSLAICGVILFGADFITAIILGPEFAQSSAALRILAPAVVFAFLGHLASFLLRSADHQGKDTANWGLSLAANLVLSIVLIPRFGLAGAAFALLVSEAVFGILGLTAVTRHISPLPGRKVFLGPLACGLLTAAIMVPLQRFTFPVSFLVGAIVYLTSIYAFGILSAREKELVRDMAGSVAPSWRSSR